MDIIETARELGKEIQKDERFAKYQVKEAICENDAVLQDQISRFNLLKMSISHEAQKADKDEEKIAQINKDMRAMYDTIMQNPKMVEYNEAKGEISEVLKHINTIIERSASGDDPATIDISGCTGSCSGCSGCH